MSVAIDQAASRKIAQIIKEGSGEYKCLRDAREAGLPVIPYRDAAIILCLPVAERFVKSVVRLPGISRVEVEDLEQAARLGIVEGVDSFEPSRNVKIQTHLWMRMRLRVNQERALGHWIIMRPPKAMIEKYMSGQMTENEKADYLARFIVPSDESAMVMDAW